MATATITVVLPTTRKDGTAFTPADYGSANIFKDGVSIASLTAPALVAADTAVVPGVSVYTCTITDTQSPPQVSDLSAPVTAPKSAVLAAPGAPALTVTVA